MIKIGGVTVSLIDLALFATAGAVCAWLIHEWWEDMQRHRKAAEFDRLRQEQRELEQALWQPDADVQQINKILDQMEQYK